MDQFKPGPESPWRLSALLGSLVVCALVAGWAAWHTDGTMGESLLLRGVVLPLGSLIAFLMALFTALSIARSKNALRESEERYRELIEGHSDLITRVTPSGEITFVNNVAEQVFGIPAKDCIGQSIFDFIHVDDAVRTRQWFDACRTSKKCQASIENRQVNRQNGDVIHMLWRSSFRYGPSGELEGINSIGRDITIRKRAEEALHLTRFSIEQVDDAVFWISPEARIIDVNEAACRSLGYSRQEILALTVPDIDNDFDSVRWKPHWEALKSEGTLRFETHHCDKSGHVFPVEITANFIDYGGVELNCAVVRNMTAHKMAAEERLLLERQLQHTQKLESLGVLAGGIAHDFNNILAAVLGHAELAMLEVSENQSAMAHVREIVKGANRAADLTRQMLAYSGRGKFLLQSLDVSALVDDMAQLLRTSIPRSITLNLDLNRTLPEIRADAAQVQQVVMNLITNAAEAIGDANGSIALITDFMECDAAYLAKSLVTVSPEGDPDIPGAYVFFEITDTGVGMSEATRAHLFDPFFTTKFTGRGLGMAAVLGIVRSHCGAIMLDSAPGKGSTFRVLFPVAPPAARIAAAPESNAVSRRDYRPSEGAVLVVDDEIGVRSLVHAMLKRKGFAVLEASDGLEALEVFRVHANEIVCVLLDLTMPRMGGRACLQELEKIRADVPVIFMSGYDDQEALTRSPGDGPRGFIHKPFQMMELNDKIEEFTHEEAAT